MLTTRLSLPMPADSEPFANGGQAIRELAEAIDDQLLKGSAVVNVAAATFGSLAVVFAEPYDTPPVVVATALNVSYFATATNITVNGFTLNCTHFQATVATIAVPANWIALGS